MKFFTLNKVFTSWVIVFFLIILGVIPRDFALYSTIALCIYLIFAPLTDSTLFFIRSVPLFIAIPFTEAFDNFNMWRVLSFVIFLKWAIQGGFKKIVSDKLSLLKTPLKFSMERPVYVILSGLLLISVLSILVAPDKAAAIKRVVYFINLSLIGWVIADLLRRIENLDRRIIKNLAIPVIITIAIGFAQIISTYFIDIYQFMRIWGEGIQMRQYGRLWSDIVVQLGNTWFAYYGEQLSLRVFSLFTDSHTFPMYLLMGIPALFAISVVKLVPLANSLKTMVKTRARLHVIWVAAALFMAILSGTRGIWAAWVGVLILAIIIWTWMNKSGVSRERKNIFRYIALYLAVFVLLFSIAYPVFVSPQFLLSKGDLGLLGNRIRSIIDFGETSNSQRIEIWRKSWDSIKNRPILGVGIGNFPIVLGQDVILAKAGSSAHNLYIQIAAELGIPALLLALGFLWLVFKRTYQNFVAARDPMLMIYLGAALLYIPWVLIYLLTDAALFDERAFLMFVITVVLLIKKPISKIG